VAVSLSPYQATASAKIRTSSASAPIDCIPWHERLTMGTFDKNRVGRDEPDKIFPAQPFGKAFERTTTPLIEPTR